MASVEGLEVVVDELADGRELVRVAGDLDPATIAGLEDALAARDASRTAVLDLTECTFLDSSAIHVILKEAGRRQAAGGEMSLVAPDAAIRRPLEIAQVDRMLPIRASVADAS
jgi:anti-sigma B factor antagonist